MVCVRAINRGPHASTTKATLRLSADTLSGVLQTVFARKTMTAMCQQATEWLGIQTGVENIYLSLATSEGRPRPNPSLCPFGPLSGWLRLQVCRDRSRSSAVMTPEFQVPSSNP